MSCLQFLCSDVSHFVFTCPTRELGPLPLVYNLCCTSTFLLEVRFAPANAMKLDSNPLSFFLFSVMFSGLSGWVFDHWSILSHPDWRSGAVTAVGLCAIFFIGF
jgi:hypothetical protein